MRKLCAFVLLLVFAVNDYGAPLIFKSRKPARLGETVILGDIDTAKYKQIKISIISANGNYPKMIAVRGIEGGESYDIELDEQTDLKTNYSKVFDLPPSLVRITVQGNNGIYKLYVWGSQ